MNHNYYAIFDKAAGKHVHVFESDNDKTAARMFHIMEENPESFIGVKPEDYILNFAGYFDDISGSFGSNGVTHKVCEGKPKD